MCGVLFIFVLSETVISDTVCILSHVFILHIPVPHRVPP